MIHIFSRNGITLVLDIYSGSVHVVDEDAAALIRLKEHRTDDEALQAFLAQRPDADVAEVLEALAQVNALQKSGKLYTKDTAFQKAAAIRREPGRLKALCLNVAHTCNLTCSYCFAAQGHYQGEAALMSFEVGKRALDYLVEQSQGRRNLEVDFFGGEPLLNWPVVKQLVAYGRQLEAQHNKRFRFTLTTNGMLLDDEVMDFCNREMHNVVLSLDGRPHVHDRFRVDHMGRGSYHKVVPLFQQFVHSRGGKGYYIRGTFTRHNLDFVEDVLHMADLGFTELSMEPMVGSPDDPASLRAEDMPVLFEQYEKLADIMLERHREGRPFNFYHYTLDLQAGPCLHKRLSGCGTGTEYLAVTPTGELYPCHQFIGDAGWQLGDVWHGVTAPERQAAFLQRDLAQHPDCGPCWAKLYCAGGCAANALHASGDVAGTYPFGCELFKKRMECALILQVSLAQEEKLG